jgi:hypothetical protein
VKKSKPLILAVAATRCKINWLGFRLFLGSILSHQILTAANVGGLIFHGRFGAESFVVETILELFHWDAICKNGRKKREARQSSCYG